jgi:hypothetical protein
VLMLLSVERTMGPKLQQSLNRSDIGSKTTLVAAVAACPAGRHALAMPS